MCRKPYKTPLHRGKIGHSKERRKKAAYISLIEASKLGKLNDGDLVVMLGAGTGYTWAATALSWGKA